MTIDTRPPTDLQAKKRAAAARFEAIAAAHLPKGWRVVRYRKSLSGYCDLVDKIIVVPRPRSRRALYIFLHECAHAVLHHKRNGKPRHVEELEAELWAHAAMRAAGVPVPHSMTARARRHVAHKIQQAVRRGAKKIDAKARHFAGIKGAP